MPSTKLGFTMILVGLSLANLPLLAQTPAACMGQLVPIKPSNLFCSNAAPVCATDQSGVRGRWIWGCPVPAASSPAPSGPDWTKLLPQPPPAESASDIALKAAQARQMRQQTELMREQAEALRRQNENQVVESLTTDPETPYLPLADAYATMPIPTGNKKRDQKNWEKWTRKNPMVSTVLPPMEYGRIRAGSENGCRTSNRALKAAIEALLAN